MKDYLLDASVSLRRNYADLPFDAATCAETAGRVNERAMGALERAGESYAYLPEKSLPEEKRGELTACRLLCPDNGDAESAVLFLRMDDQAGVETAGEDHLLISAYDKNGNAEQCLHSCRHIEELMADSGLLAKNARYGYLTARPCDAGTGMRAALRLHLPMTAAAKQLQAAGKVAAAAGMAFRVENGGFCLLENRVTMGEEDALLSRLTDCGKKLCAIERTLRWRARERKDLNVADKAWRAYGTARYALRAGTQEALQWWSALTLGRSVAETPCGEEALDALWQIAHATRETLARDTELHPDVERARRIRALFNGGE